MRRNARFACDRTAGERPMSLKAGVAGSNVILWEMARSSSGF
jgi:hypothetical protein